MFDSQIKVSTRDEVIFGDEAQFNISVIIHRFVMIHSVVRCRRSTIKKSFMGKQHPLSTRDSILTNGEFTCSMSSVSK